MDSGNNKSIKTLLMNRIAIDYNLRDMNYLIQGDNCFQ
jgi:hypothetical protein